MATQYVHYPKSGGGSSSGSSTGVPYVVGPLNGAAASPNGAVIGSFTLFMQTATNTRPGLAVSLTTVTETSSSVLTLNNFSNATVGSGTSPTIQVTQATGSVSGFLSNSDWLRFDGKLTGTSSFMNFNRIAFWMDSGATGKYIAAANPSPTVSMTGAMNTFGLTVSNGSAFQVGSMTGIIAGVAGVYRAVSGTPSFSLGSVTYTSSAGGAAYTLTWPGAQGGALTFPQNDGAGNISWVTVASNSTFNQPIIMIANGSQSFTQGGLYFDNASLSPTFFNTVSSISLQIGQENWVYVRNNSGATIGNGRAVYFNGSVANGDTPTIALAQANTSSTSQLAGVATHDIANNGFGFVTQYGKVHGLDTSAYSGGQRVWLSASSAGFFQTSEPIAPNYNVFVGYVLDTGSTTGSLFLPSIRFGAINPTNSFRAIVLGSITMAQTVGGATYSLNWPSAQGAAGTAPQNDGSGNLIWAPLTVNSISIVTTTYNMAANDSTIVLSSGTGRVNLITAVGRQGKEVSLIQNFDSLSFDPINVFGSVSSFGVVGSTSLNTFGEGLTLVSDNTNWKIKNRNIPSYWRSDINLTPLAGSFGTISSLSCQTKRIGDSWAVRMYFQNGTVAVGNPNISLPTGAVIDLQKAARDGIKTTFGRWACMQTSSSSYTDTQSEGPVLCEPSTGAVFILSQTGALAVGTRSNINSFAGSNSGMSIDALIPIVGWNG